MGVIPMKGDLNFKTMCVLILLSVLIVYGCDQRKTDDPLPTPTPSPIETEVELPAPSPQIFEPPLEKGTPILEAPAMPRADKPYKCTIITHIEPLPYCVNWNRWNWYSDLFSIDGNFATRQVMHLGIYEQVLNYSEYIDKVELEFRCQYGVHTFNHSGDSWIWVNVTADELEVFASDPNLISDITEKSWFTWCEKEVPAYTECFFSYNAQKTPYYSCKDTIATELQVWIFALTQDDTQVQMLDWYKNGVFYHSELNPPYDLKSPPTYYQGTEGEIISIGFVTYLKNGSIEDTSDPLDAGYITFKSIPDPSCGDLICNGLEDCSTCAIDCGNCHECGDDVCDFDETCVNCELDCGVCPDVCGDGTCDTTEDCVICEADCGVCPPVCGDDDCNGDETCSDCPGDCGICPPVCGDMECNGEESCWDCPGDCGDCPTCDCCEWCAAPFNIQIDHYCQPFPFVIDDMDFACNINTGGIYECIQVN